MDMEIFTSLPNVPSQKAQKKRPPVRICFIRTGQSPTAVYSLLFVVTAPDRIPVAPGRHALHPLEEAVEAVLIAHADRLADLRHTHIGGQKIPGNGALDLIPHLSVLRKKVGWGSSKCPYFFYAPMGAFFVCNSRFL